jgi:hypothetical protein
MVGVERNNQLAIIWIYISSLLWKTLASTHQFIKMMKIYIEFSSLGDASFKHFLCDRMIIHDNVDTLVVYCEKHLHQRISSLKGEWNEKLRGWPNFIGINLTF